MTDLAEFLLARFAEDALLARDAGECEQEPHPHWSATISAGEGTTIVEDCGCVIADRPSDAVVPGCVAEHIPRWDPARVLAECEAKRGMIEAFGRCSHAERTAPHGDMRNVLGAKMDSWRVALRLLALPYADHPDWREEWRP